MFKDMDASPTLEEYALMLNLPQTNKSPVNITELFDRSRHSE